MERKPLYMKRFTLALFLFTTLHSCSNTEIEVTKDTPADTEVRAAQIFKDYTENEVAANQKYKNKVLSVSGIIASISNYGSQTKVVLNDGNPENVGVICYFKKEHESDIAQLKKGSQIKVKGIGQGDLSIDFDMENCILEQ